MGTPARELGSPLLEMDSSEPGPDESPWRSAFWVTPRHSVDGNSYRPGDPIPFAEAVRQGIVGNEPPVRPATRICPRCNRTGLFTSPKPKGHKAGCGCRFCQVCPRCKGRGYVDQEGSDG